MFAPTAQEQAERQMGQFLKSILTARTQLHLIYRSKDCCLLLLGAVRRPSQQGCRSKGIRRLSKYFQTLLLVLVHIFRGKIPCPRVKLVFFRTEDLATFFQFNSYRVWFSFWFISSIKFFTIWVILLFCFIIFWIRVSRVVEKVTLTVAMTTRKSFSLILSFQMLSSFWVAFPLNTIFWLSSSKPLSSLIFYFSSRICIVINLNYTGRWLDFDIHLLSLQGFYCYLHFVFAI